MLLAIADTATLISCTIFTSPLPPPDFTGESDPSGVTLIVCFDAGISAFPLSPPIFLPIMFPMISLLTLFDAKQTALFGNLTTSSKLKAGELNFLTLFK